MKKKYIVTLTEEERQTLQAMLSRGNAAARKLMHARILLKADAGEGGPDWRDAAIADGLEVGRATVERVRKRFVEEGFEAALDRTICTFSYREIEDHNYTVKFDYSVSYLALSENQSGVMLSRVLKSNQLMPQLQSMVSPLVLQMKWQSLQVTLYSSSVSLTIPG